MENNNSETKKMHAIKEKQEELHQDAPAMDDHTVELAEEEPQNVQSKSIQNKPKRAKSVTQKKKPKKRLPLWARIILKTLRVLLVPALCVIAVLGGMIIGYVYIGNQEMSDVFQIETWRHLYDLVFKDNVDT